MARIRANGHMFAVDFVKDMLEGLRDRRTVTQYVWDSRDGKLDPIEFELRVTRIGKTRLPRMVAGTKGSKA